jgi:hypothetical protein
MDLSGARPAGERRTGRQDETQTADERAKCTVGSDEYRRPRSVHGSV